MRRRGLISGCVLVCLIVTVSLTASSLRSTLRARREVATRHQLLQTDWLLHAGIQLARDQLAKQDDYQGETWQPQNVIAGDYEARVVIKVTEGENEAAIAEVVATLANSPRRGDRLHAFVTRRSHQWPIQRSINSSSE